VASAAKAARVTRSTAARANATAARRRNAMMNPEENNIPKNRENSDQSRDRHEDTPGLDPDKHRRSERGTDHIEDPEEVAEHVSDIDREDKGEEE